MKAYKKKQMLLGLATGFINGLFGGGGGTVAVLIMESMLKVNKKKSHATALAIVFPITVLSAVLYLIKGYFTPSQGVPVTVGVIIGGLIGTKLLVKCNEKVIGIVFAVVLFLSGLKMVT